MSSTAKQNAETSMVNSTKSTVSHQWKPHHLTAPKSPLLQTSLRARPPRTKSSEVLEKEGLENILQFKARPLNRKLSIHLQNLTTRSLFVEILTKSIPSPNRGDNIFRLGRWSSPQR